VRSPIERSCSTAPVLPPTPPGPLVEACLRTGTDYLDITGEIDVFRAVVARDRRAWEAGATLLPGAGFDVVPTDCLAAHLHRRLPDATELALGISGLGSLSPGTAATPIENAGGDSLVRRAGRLRTVPFGSVTREIDFGRGPDHAVGMPAGDLVTA
jgi:short subunit dehydrogenase-like uncharacterized protein